MQNIWAFGSDWDDELPPSLTRQVQEWLADVQNLAEVKVPRCLRTISGETPLHLHVFVDASKEPYGAVAYAVQQSNDGEIVSRFVASKR